jgi:hypothetical protein
MLFKPNHLSQDVEKRHGAAIKKGERVIFQGAR